jgi:hypothetical protein
MNDNIIENALINGAALTDNDLFVDLFNTKKQDETFTFDFDKIIRCTVEIDRPEFIKAIERLNVTDEVKQELYHVGLKIAIAGGKLKYMEECLKRLKTVEIYNVTILNAISLKRDNIVKYLITHGYYRNHSHAIVYAATHDNIFLLDWLLDNYNISFYHRKSLKIKIYENHQKIIELLNFA